MESKREYDRYKSTGKIVYLHQAGDKLYYVIENWLSAKYNVQVSSYKQLRDVVKNNRCDRELLSKVKILKNISSDDVLRGIPEEFEDIYLECYVIMEKMMSSNPTKNPKM